VSVGAPEPYRVVYSPRVREYLLGLSDVARDRGDFKAFAAALREFDRRLHIYPQFGDPLTDLFAESGHVRIGINLPLSVRYAVLEERRQVSVGALPVLLPKSRS
jgi:hypothetical protein